MDKQKLYDLIEAKKDLIIDVSDKIWEYAELSLLEFKSTELYVKVLKEEGFEVEENIAGIPTAFTGAYGSGKPVIGILAEYDALSGCSQVPGLTERKEYVEGGTGQGCGHNMLGAGSLAAAIAVKEYLQKKGPNSGTVIFYGCPGEEGGAGKAFMAREGMFYKLDAALTWHPGDTNQVSTGSCNSSIQVEYKFTGISAHAAGDPELGRSALDGVEMMNIGVQFLREHMPDSNRIHYAITDAGGNSPNVVQPTAQVLYMVRGSTVQQALDLLKRVDNIAKAAAMMSETALSRRFIDGTADLVSNSVLEDLLYKNLQEAPLPAYTKEEMDYAAKLRSTFILSDTKLAGDVTMQSNPELYAKIKKLTDNNKKVMNDFVVPYYHSYGQSMGSTDVGDVSWQTPTAQINTATWPSGNPGHSWQNVSCGKTSIGHKGVLLAGKVLAGAAVDLFENPDIIQKAKAEFDEKTEKGYQCPIEADAIPTAVGGKF